MRELKAWVNGSAENKRYFQQKLDAWTADINTAQSHYFNKEQAYLRFKERVDRAKNIINSTGAEASDRHTLPLRSKRGYYRIASYAAVLLVLIGIVYFIKTGAFTGAGHQADKASLSFIEIKVPAGSREQFTLPDKTVVWVNAGSVFKYPAGFSGKTREVYLNGEGYFQVAKDATHPFIVNTTKGNITVTGTTFNVYAYDTKPRFVTALLEGHVHVNTPDGQVVNLLPSQKAELKGTRLNISPISDPDEYRWMEGLICFENQRITDVLENLENTFGQKIIIRHLAEPDLLLTGKFRVSDGLDYALKVLSESYDMKYKKDTASKSYIILN